MKKALILLFTFAIIMSFYFTTVYASDYDSHIDEHVAVPNSNSELSIDWEKGKSDVPLIHYNTPDTKAKIIIRDETNNKVTELSVPSQDVMITSKSAINHSKLYAFIIGFLSATVLSALFFIYTKHKSKSQSIQD